MIRYLGLVSVPIGLFNFTVLIVIFRLVEREEHAKVGLIGCRLVSHVICNSEMFSFSGNKKFNCFVN